MINQGDIAPEFSLSDQYEKRRTLNDFLGYWFLLYFFNVGEVKFISEDCRSFACNYNLLKASGFSVVGISLASSASQLAFGESHKLPYITLSDMSGEVSRRYGVLDNKYLSNGDLLVEDNSFLIDPTGLVAKVYLNKSPVKSVGDIKTDVRSLVSAFERLPVRQ